MSEPEIKPRVDEKTGDRLCDSRCSLFILAEKVIRLTAENAALRGLIEGIHVYASDCLSGPDKGPVTVLWCIRGFQEIARRAAIDAKEK